MSDTKTTEFFPEPIPIITSNKELDALKLAMPKLDGYYLASASIADRRRLFEWLWSEYKPYADDDFLKQHKFSFHQRSWEMYLGNIFLRRGFRLQKAIRNAPDICLLTPRGKLWIEAIAPGHGTGPDRVPEMLMGVGQSVDFEKISMRVSSALKEKFEKLQKYIRDGSVKLEEPYVIAVNRGFYSIGDPYEMPLIMQSLFALGPLTIAFTPGGSKRETYYARRPSIGKGNGTTVPMTFFEDPAHAAVSAVIYSTQNVLNTGMAALEDPKRIGKDCVVVHNPNATNPIPKSRFKFLVQYGVDNEGYLKKF